MISQHSTLGLSGSCAMAQFMTLRLLNSRFMLIETLKGAAKEFQS